MQYRQMPKTGENVSLLGYGCMRLPMQGHAIDEPRAIRQIRSAADRGVNYFDTAWPYHGGESERLLGRALREGYRNKVHIATKLPCWLVQNRADMDRFLNEQLDKLQTDRIDYYLLHSLSGESWRAIRDLGALEFLDAAHRDGRIRHAGFSFHGPSADFAPIVDAYPWVFCQIQYNYLDRDYQAGAAGMRYAAGKGLGVIVMEPLRGGNLCPPVLPESVRTIWAAAPTRRTPAEWALRWLWNQPEVTTVLSGMNDEAQVEENIAIAGTARAGELTAQELALIDRVTEQYRRLIRVGCTGCGYCLPCPAQVQIPKCFEEYNNLHMFHDERSSKFRYTIVAGGILGGAKPGFASQCVNCGACLDKCPQQLPIPDLLKQAAADLEGPDLPQRIEMIRQMFLKQ